MEDAIREAIEFLQAKMKDNLAVQGHVLTGKLRDSIVYQIEKTSTSTTARLLIEDYGIFVEYGVAAEKIPYSGRGKGRAAKSQYIEGLKIFFQRRGLADVEASRAAFATAEKHRRVGMPTPDSRRFSQTGSRTGFAKESVEQVLPKIIEIFEQSFGRRMNVEFGGIFGNSEKIKMQI